VKIDNQGSLQYLADRLGGRAKLFKTFRSALEASVKRHFKGALINCMGHPLENWYQSPVSNLMRTSTDFWPKRPETHGLHLYTNSQVCLWFGEFLLGDWDMFQSGHEMGGFHAAGRAVSGSPVYVSDKPGGHNVALLRKLVCSDGTTLRALEPGRPTADCLFRDVTREPVLLKIFNRNKHGAVVGAFNARHHAQEAERTVLQGEVRPSDVPTAEAGEFVLHGHVSGQICRVTREQGMALALPEGQFEVVTIVPVLEGVAVIGLTNFFNASGAIESLTRRAGTVRVGVCDGGAFEAVCGKRPSKVQVDGAETVFEFKPENGLLTVAIAAPGRHMVEIMTA
jgi:raffinose synthase